MNAVEKPPLAIASLRRRLGHYFLAVALAPLVVGTALAAVLPSGTRGLVLAFGAGTLASAALGWLAARRLGAGLRLVAAGAPGESPAALETRVRERTGEIEAARAELEQRSRRGEEVDRLKSVFIANMSHEIRTPLNSVLALSQLLRDGVGGPLTVDQRKYLEVIERNGQNLLRLINDILDLSRIEAGHLEMDLQDLDLAPNIAEVVAALSPLAMAKDLDVTVKLPEGLPLVRCDVDRLRQILNNLIGNAIKFTDAGMVQVSAEALPGGVAIHITDTGVGIPRADLARVFEEFFQVDQTLARRQGGTGLGLAIATRLARLMGGEITVSSIVGSGSRFTLTLPRARVESHLGTTAEDALARRGGAGAGAEPTATDAPGTGAGDVEQLASRRGQPAVLLVEDNEDNLFTLRQVLGRLPLEISTATTGRQAIERCRRELPDLVILDVQMPGMSGLQATGGIRALPGGAAVPIVALTAQAMKGDRERILAAGCDEYLSKPVQPKALLEVVARLLARAAEAAPPRTGAGAGPQPQGEKPDGAHPPRR